jgi:hypothetical protein
MTPGRDTLAWAAALATALWQRLLLPLLLLAIDTCQASETRETHAPGVLGLPTPAELEGMTCAQLRLMGGISSHLPKRQLIARILSAHPATAPTLEPVRAL